MRELSLLMSFFVFIVGCSDSGAGDKKNITNNEGSLQQSEILDTCFCLDLELDSNGVHYLEEKPFTGICIENYRGSESKYIEKSILSGMLHGKSTFYSRDGKILVEEVYDQGDKKRSGENMPLKCDCSELIKASEVSVDGKTRVLLDDIPFTGECQKYYPDSSGVYMKVNYYNGLLEGRTSYFEKDGSKMYSENYESGELVKTYY